jgi:hypothetical protein
MCRRFCVLESQCSNDLHVPDIAEASFSAVYHHPVHALQEEAVELRNFQGPIGQDGDNGRGIDKPPSHACEARHRLCISTVVRDRPQHMMYASHVH